MLRSVLSSASESARVEHLVTTAPVSRGIVRRFVGGADAEAAVLSVATLVGHGLDVSLAHLGADVTDGDQAAASAEAYARLVKQLSLAGLVARAGPRKPGPGDSRIDLSVKLTALGLALGSDGPSIAYENAHQVCKSARRIGATVTLDMGEHRWVDPTLEVLAKLREDFPETGVALQAYLPRTEADCRGLTGSRSRVRLCKGAYSPPTGLAYTARADVERSYVRCLRVLMDGEGYPMVATHDQRLITVAQRLAERAGRDRNGYEHQMRYGVRPHAQLAMVQKLQRVRVYVPYGAQWYRYLMRRLVERPANLALFARAVGWPR